MSFLKQLNQQLDELHLLKHPFYQYWGAGELSQEALKIYASEYYHHVAAFPRYISQIHSLCANIKDRQVLLGNLIEEEQGEENHPELWLRFAEGLGVSRQECQRTAELTQTHTLVDGYFGLVNKDYETGLGALYAYERQTPAVSTSKIDGLKKYYDIQDERSLQFFTVHQKADEWHTEEVAGLINTLTPEGKKRAAKGAEDGAKLLWSFLDGMMEKTCAH